VTGGVENTLKFISPSAAIEALQAQRPVSPEALRTFMDAVAENVVETEASLSRPDPHAYLKPKKTSVLAEFSQTLCDLLLESDDAALVKLFFTTICANVKDKSNLVATVTTLVRKFEWSDIGEAVMSSLEEKDPQSSYMSSWMSRSVDTGILASLAIPNGLDDGPEKQGVLKSAVKNAVATRDQQLCSSKELGQLWKGTIQSGDKATLEMLAEKFKQMDPSVLRPILDVSHCALHSQHGCIGRDVCCAGVARRGSDPVAAKSTPRHGEALLVGDAQS
jgi:hypothetical protein